MIRILYLSQSAHDLADQQVQLILESSRRNNPGLGLTGVLVYGGGLFIQVLEGPDNSVLRMYSKILDDKRHGDCQIVHISPTNERIFQKWSMGVIKSNPLQFHQMTQLREQRFESVHPKAFTAGMNEFLKMLNTGHSAEAAPAKKTVE
jgi:hypothetical protein